MANFKITFKGDGMDQEFEYVCKQCNEVTTIVQKRSEDMSHRKCKKCSKPHKPVYLLRYFSEAPGIDADLHEAGKTHNIGWD